MLEQCLKNIIPNQLDTFPKLKTGTNPYYFEKWDADTNTNDTIIRYWFWSKEKTNKHRKRVFVSEIKNLLIKCLHQNTLTRDDFKEQCKKTKSDGECGYAVIIGIFEHLGVIKKVKQGLFEVINREKINRILAKKINVG